MQLRWVLILWLTALAISGCGRIGFDDVGAAANGACPAFAILCDDFESGNLDKWDRIVITGPSTARVDGTRPHAGAFSLDAQTQPNGSAGQASPRFAIPSKTTGMLAAREWVNLATPLTDFDLVMELRLEADASFTTAGGDSAQHWVSTEARPGSSTTDHQTTVPVPGVNQWICVELNYTFRSGADRIQMFVNDAPVLDVDAITPDPVIDRVGIGATRSDQAGFHVFEDDVVIAEQHIGCQ